MSRLKTFKIPITIRSQHVMILLNRSVFFGLDAAIFIAALWRSNATRSSVMIGLAFMLSGLSLRCAASLSKIDHGVPSIVGIYRFLRAPYLLGSGLVWVGAAIAARDFSLLLFSLAVVAIFGGWVIAAVERIGLRGEQFVRMSYLRDVPMLIPQLFPFAYKDSILEVGAKNPFYSRSGIFREWVCIFLMIVVLVGFWCTMRYLSLHREIASACTLFILLVVSVRLYRDISAGSRLDFQQTLRF